MSIIKRLWDMKRNASVGKKPFPFPQFFWRPARREHHNMQPFTYHLPFLWPCPYCPYAQNFQQSKQEIRCWRMYTSIGRHCMHENTFLSNCDVCSFLVLRLCCATILNVLWSPQLSSIRVGAQKKSACFQTHHMYQIWGRGTNVLQNSVTSLVCSKLGS